MLEKSEKTAYWEASYFILAIYNIEVVPIKKDEIGGTCHVGGANEKYKHYFDLWNLEDREKLSDMTNGGVILNRIKEKPLSYTTTTNATHVVVLVVVVVVVVVVVQIWTS